MPVIQHSFRSMRQDPFNNLIVDVDDCQVDVTVHAHDHSVGIRLSHEEARRLAETLLKEINPPIIGYLPGGQRIHPCDPNRIYSAAIVSCSGCGQVIRGAGGHLHQAQCPTCWEEK